MFANLPLGRPSLCLSARVAMETQQLEITERLHEDGCMPERRSVVIGCRVSCAVIARVRLSVCLCICSLLSLHPSACVCVCAALAPVTDVLSAENQLRSIAPKQHFYRSADLADASSIAVSQTSHDQNVSVHFSHSCVRLMNVNTRVIDYKTDFIHSLKPRLVQTH